MSAGTIFVFESESRPTDQTRYRVISEQPISEAQAFTAFRHWAEMNMAHHAGTGKVIDIPYTEWHAAKPPAERKPVFPRNKL